MKKIYSLVAGLLAFSGVSGQLLQENFDAGIPGTWTVTDGGAATGDTWVAGQQAGFNNLDGSDCAFVDSDANGNGTHLIETLESPAFNGTGFLSVILEFDHYYRSIEAVDFGTVEVWDGTAWQQVAVFNNDIGAFGAPDHQIIDITAHANPAMQVRFHYDDGNTWDYYWLIDNVVINGNLCDAVSGLAVNNITTTSADLSWTTTATNVDLQWGAPGFTPGTGTELGSIYTANNPETAAGLMPATFYDAYVRTNCSGPAMMISGVFDGPLTGGQPKAVELYVMDNIADLSQYGIGSANNGGGTDGEELSFSAISATAGQYIYVTTDSADFHDYFGFAADFVDGSAPNINGDDAVELFYNGVAYDVFGDINLDGTGQPWEYLDGWAYRNNGTQSTTTFAVADWTYSGINAVDGCTTNGACASVFPNGTFTTNLFSSGWLGPVSFMTNCAVFSAPYCEDFEDGGAVDGCWTNEAATDDFDWSALTGATGSTATGPSSGNGGAGYYIYTEASPQGNGDAAVIYSPEIDLSTIPGTPRLNFFYHMYGAGMNPDGSITVDVSNDGGGSWTNIFDEQGDQGDVWNQAFVTLAAWSSDTVTFRITGTVAPSTTGNAYENDFAIDDFCIDEAPADEAQLNSILTPFGGCGLTANDSLTISVTNNGADTIFTMDMCYVLNATAPVCETFNDTILPGGTDTIVFTAPIDLSTPGAYDFDVYITLAGDTLNTNDSIFGYSIQSVPTISTFPYSEDFEADNGGWTSEGSGEWEWGAPAGGVINSVSACEGGVNAWVTNLTGNYADNANSDLVSPCIDMSSQTTDPVIVFDITTDSETNWDGTILEVSTDGGGTWTQLGAVGTGANWYNNATDVWWDGTTPWMKAGHVLTGTAGQSDVRLRFKFTSDGSNTQEGVAIDNIEINPTAPIVSAVPSALVAPTSSCGLTANEFVIADFANNGVDTLFSFDVCYIIGGTPVCETVNDTLLPGGTYQHAFATAGDFSTVGNIDVDLTIAATGDLSDCDDTLTAVVVNKPVITSYPYLETFENGQGGWSANNIANSTWEFGTPAQTNINTAFTGMNAWVAGGLTGGYNNNEEGNVESPCFDFTALPTGSWVAMKIAMDCEFSWDGANLQLSDDAGATWTNVGAFGAPDWYNDNSIGAFTGNQDGWTGSVVQGSSTGEWIVVKHPLDDTLIGKTDVRFRVNFETDGSGIYEGFAFDDFAISTLPTVDAGPDYNGCGSHLIDPGLVGMYEWFTQDTSAAPTTYPHSNGTSATFANTGLTDTTYNAIVVYTDSFGLCMSDTAMLTLNPAPLVELNDVSNCVGDTAWFNVDTSSVYTYSWNTGATIDSSFLAGPGQIVATVTHTGTGCTHSDSANVYQVPLVDLDPVLSACDGDSIFVDAGPNYDVYLWDDGAATSSIYVYTTDTVQVTVTDSIGCVSSDSAILTVNPLPMPTITGTSTSTSTIDTICVNHDISLDAGAGFSAYDWSTGGTSQTEPVSGSTLGTGSHDIIVMVTDGNNCMNSDTVTIFVDPCTGIDGLDAIGFTVYPNPSNGIFKYNVDELNNAMTFRLTDATGKLINTWTINNAQVGTIDLTGYARGVYILNVVYGEGQKSIQLIKQ